MAISVVSIKRLTKTFAKGEITALQEIDLEIQARVRFSALLASQLEHASFRG